MGFDGAAGFHPRETGGGGGGFYQIVEDEGIALPQRVILNFIGNGVTVTDVGGKTTVDIPGGGGGAPSGPAGGDLSGTYPNPGVTWINGYPTYDLRYPQFSGAYIDPSWIATLDWAKITGAPSSFPPSGPAGGDLSGSYPNPTVNYTGVRRQFFISGTQVLTSASILEELLVSAQLTTGLIGGDYFEWSALTRATSNANVKTYRVYLNTANTLVGATLIATYNVNTNAQTQRFTRENWVMSSTTLRNGVPAATSSQTGTGTASVDTKTVPSMAAGFWLLFTCEKAVAGDSAGFEAVQCVFSKNS